MGRRIGSVSETLLSRTLKTPEADDFVLHRAFDVAPPHVKYSLTGHGQELAIRLKALEVWFEAILPDVPVARELLIRKRPEPARLSRPACP